MLNVCTTALNAEQRKASVLISQLSLYRQDKCPTCGSDFRSGQFPEILKTINEEKKAIDGNVSILEEKASKIKASYEVYRTKREEIYGRREELRTAGKILKQQYASLKENTDGSVDNEALKVLEERLE